MSINEADRFAVIERVLAGDLAQAGAAAQLQLSLRHMKRLCKAVRHGGAAALIFKKRGRPSNRRIGAGERERIMGVVRQHYPDFGPELAGEYVRAEHGFKATLWRAADAIATLRCTTMRLSTMTIRPLLACRPRVAIAASMSPTLRTMDGCIDTPSYPADIFRGWR